MKRLLYIYIYWKPVPASFLSILLPNICRACSQIARKILVIPFETRSSTTIAKHRPILLANQICSYQQSRGEGKEEEDRPLCNDRLKEYGVASEYGKRERERVASRRKMDQGKKKRDDTGEGGCGARKKERESAAPLILPSVSLCRTIVLE